MCYENPLLSHYYKYNKKTHEPSERVKDQVVREFMRDHLRYRKVTQVALKKMKVLIFHARTSKVLKTKRTSSFKEERFLTEVFDRSTCKKKRELYLKDAFVKDILLKGKTIYTVKHF